MRSLHVNKGDTVNCSKWIRLITSSDEKKMPCTSSEVSNVPICKNGLSEEAVCGLQTVVTVLVC